MVPRFIPNKSMWAESFILKRGLYRAYDQLPMFLLRDDVSCFEFYFQIFFFVEA